MIEYFLGIITGLILSLLIGKNGTSLRRIKKDLEKEIPPKRKAEFITQRKGKNYERERFSEVLRGADKNEVSSVEFIKPISIIKKSINKVMEEGKSVMLKDL